MPKLWVVSRESGSWEGAGRTTARLSLATLVLATNDRYWDREATRAGRKADLNTKELSLDAIVAVSRYNGRSECGKCCCYNND